MNFTSIQASWFMEAWLSPLLGFDYVHGRVTIFGEGTNPISWVSYRDVARFSVAALLQPLASRSVVEFGGPETLSPLDVVRIFEEESGRKFDLTTIPEAMLRNDFDAATDALEKSFLGLKLQYAGGDAIDMRRALDFFPMRLKSVREYARGVLAVKPAAA